MNTFQLGAIVLTAYYFLSCKAQSADNSYDVSVKDPYYKVDYPKVLFDNAHNNVHTSTGTYSPFVNLLKNDGCLVVGNKDDFSMELLEQYNLLVISNAKGKKDKSDPAFTDEECMVVEKWVSGGGSLLLIADHYPMGSSAQNISQRFGVTMSNGETSDSIHYQGNQKFKDELVFSRTNGLLMDNEISNGKDSSDRINTVFTFRGHCQGY
jgi:hypothetical protein